jgi:hypothetical protein
MVLAVDMASCRHVVLLTPAALLKLGLSHAAMGARSHDAGPMPRLRFCVIPARRACEPAADVHRVPHVSLTLTIWGTTTTRSTLVVSH